MLLSGYSSAVALGALHAPQGRQSDADKRDALVGDERLVERCRAGSEEAFTAVVARYEAALIRHCSRIVGRSAAEDAVQEAFVAAWVALRAGAEVRGLRPWLFTIARRKALNARAHNQPVSELSEAIGGDRSAADQAAEAARAREALAALAALPMAQRDALVGSALLGISGEQLARQLGVGEPTVRQLVFRARARLREAACVASPLALARVIRRSVRGGPTSSPLAAGMAAKAAAVVVVAAVAVGAGVGLRAGAKPRRPPLTRAPSLAVPRIAGRAATPVTHAAGSATAERGRGRPVVAAAAPRRVRHAAVGSTVRAAAVSAAIEGPGAISSGSAPAAALPAGGVAGTPSAPAASTHDETPAPLHTVTPVVGALAPAGGATLGSVTHSSAAPLSGVAAKAGSALKQGVSTVTAGATQALGGAGTVVAGVGSVAQGAGTIASGVAAGAQGAGTVASGVGTVAQGAGTVVQGVGTVASGVGTAATGAVGAVSGAGQAVVSGATSALGSVLAGHGSTGASGALGVIGIG